MLASIENWPKSSLQKLDFLNSKYQAKKILVTGGASFIGSHLVDALLSMNCRVIVTDNFTSGKKVNLTLDHINLEIIDLDLFNSNNLAQIFIGVDHVFHLAAIHGGRGFIEKFPEKMMMNLGIDTKVFQAAISSDVKCIVHASSACAYPITKQSHIGALNTLSERDSGTMESEGAFPDGAYGWTKLIGEYQLKQMTRGTNTKGRSVRIFTAYGERENESHAAIALIARGLIHLDPYTIWGNGLQSRNFTYVTDTVVGILLAGIDESSDQFDILNVGTSSHITIDNFIQTIFKIIDWEPREVFRDLSKPQGVAARASNNDLIRSKFDWEPTVSIQEGLERTIKWYQNQESRPRTFEDLEKLLESR
jgi:nucleoside-diphosphate-sugar epimerase